MRRSTCFEKRARSIAFSLAHTRILSYFPPFTLSDNLNTNRTKNKPVTSSDGRLRCWNSEKLCEHAQCAELPSFGSSYCFSRNLTVFIYFRVFKWLHFVVATHPFGSPPLFTRSTGNQVVVVAIIYFNIQHPYRF